MVVRGQMWFFVNEPKGQIYKDLVETASLFCTKFMLVMRSDFNINGSCDKILNKLKPYLIDSRKQNAWPGTTLLNHTATVNYYHLNDSSKEVLKHAQGLFSWVHPELPEDLCFLKEDETPWLITVSHEKTGWIENCSVQEREKLMAVKGIDWKMS